jgi:O-glycosyl hydrolase
MQSNYGIPIYAISPQNEPDISQSYPSALWTAAEFDAFVPYLYSAISSSGDSPLIIMPENAAWSSSYNGFAATTMNDSAAGPHVGILAQHGYAGDSGISPAATYTSKPSHLWVTEDSSQSSTYTGTMTDALGWARIIHNYLSVANVNAFVWWFISDLPCCGGGTDNSALTDANGNIPLRAYITGNWSKFVRPGWHRVSVSNSGSLLVTAFTNSTGSQSAIVIVNTGSEVSNQVLSVGTTMGSTVSPWVTSSTQSLAQQTPVTVSGGKITYTIPADSVVTLTNVGVGPAPPTSLTGTVVSGN